MTDEIWEGFASAIVTLDLPSGRHRLEPAPVGTVGAFPFDADAHVVTAYNPAGIEASADDNRRRHTALLAAVEGLRTHPSVGSAPDGSIAEPGCAIVGIGTDVAIALGRRFGQRAIYEWSPDALVIVGVDEPIRLESGWRLTPIDRAESASPDANRDHVAVSSIADVAPPFIEIAHRIVWATVATVDRANRPRSRVLHPYWQFDDESLTGWVATMPTPLKVSNLDHSPFVSVGYWDATHDVATAECRATWHHDDETCTRVWEMFANAPEPVGYDPAIIPGWNEPTQPEFAVLRLDPWRLRVMPGTVMLAGAGEVVTWRADAGTAAGSRGG